MSVKDNYHLASSILKRPGVMFGATESLRDALALLRGAEVAKSPPHGCNFLPGFASFVNAQFNNEPYDYAHVLLREYGDLPLLDGLEAVHRLLVQWWETYPDRE